MSSVAIADQHAHLHDPQTFLTRYVWSQEHKVMAIQYMASAAVMTVHTDMRPSSATAIFRVRSLKSAQHWFSCEAPSLAPASSAANALLDGLYAQ